MRRIAIMGAAGRDFHNFNTVYRHDPDTEVVAFTATQIPFISDRVYPPALAGNRYPDGIRIHDEAELPELIRKLEVDDVVFSYSDVSHEYVMHRASEVLAAGANFLLLGPEATMLAARVPVVAVCAVRTGAGKSQTTRLAAQILREAGHHPVVVRHPMPYGDLVAERVQRFSSTEDLDSAGVTVEEREEYEHHIANGTVVYAGVDYQAILECAELEADVVLWDGGNNDLPFFRPTIHIVVADPLRAGDETAYHPGEANLRMADVVVINKVDVATSEQIARVEASIRDLNPGAFVIHAESPRHGRSPRAAGRRAGAGHRGRPHPHARGMKFGAGVVAAKAAGAEIVDPRPYAVGTIKQVLERYDVGPVIPAQGYAPQQIADMEATITAADADVVVIATPIDLRHLIRIAKPAVRVTYGLREAEGSPMLADALAPLTTLLSR